MINLEGVQKIDKKEKGGALSVQEEIILKYVPLVKSVVHRIAARLPWHIEVNDLISAGTIGLMDALEKFNPSKEIQFKTYAVFRIRGAILDELRSCDWVLRSIRRKEKLLTNTYAQLEQHLGRPAEDEEVAQALKLKLGEFQELLQQSREISLISLEDPYRGRKITEEGVLSFAESIVDPTGEDFLEEVLLEETKQILSQAVDELSPKEKLVISLYYHEELTMREIGEILQVTRSRVSQLYIKAILRLRGKFLNNKRLYDCDLNT